jgi:hypothetical protein
MAVARWRASKTESKIPESKEWEFPTDLSIPDFLRRPLTPEAQTRIDELVAEDRRKAGRP